jgi:hypothetical protein
MPKHHEIAVREVDDAHDAEDDGEPDAHQPIDRADQQARRKRLQDVLDQDTCRHHVSEAFALMLGL